METDGGKRPFFEASGLYKEWDSVTVDLSLAAERGTMTAVVGPSGSGKSTALRIIAGLEKNGSRSGGADGDFRIMLDGKDITRLPPGKRDTGMVAQSGALFLHLTVEDNVGYGLVCRGIPKRESRRMAAEFLARFNLDGFAKRYPDTLSGGEAQRVALARTLIVRPKLVLLDEPLSAVDAPLRRRLAEDIRGMQRETQFTGIMVTHDLSEAKAVSDRIVILDRGRKRWEGAPEAFSEDVFAP